MHEKQIGNVMQPIDRFVVARNQRLAMRIGARHDERKRLHRIEPCGAGKASGGLMKEQILERSIGQHHTQPRNPRRDAC